MRIAALIVKERDKWRSEGVAEGRDIVKLISRYKDIVSTDGVVSKAKGKVKEVKIDEMRLLSTGTSGGELKAVRRFH